MNMKNHISKLVDIARVDYSEVINKTVETGKANALELNGQSIMLMIDVSGQPTSIAVYPNGKMPEYYATREILKKGKKS
jgi:hypothetical protein